METVIGLFNRYEGADRAVDAWEFAGFPEGSSVVSRDKAVQERVERVQQSDWANDMAVGAGAGAVSGALVGGLAGLFISAMAIPDSGSALATAVLAIALGAAAAGMGIGAATGFVLGALVRLGFPHQVRIYAERVRRGGILVQMRAPDSYAANIARNIMRDSGAVDINRPTNELRATGEWIDFRQDIWPEDDASSTWMRIHRHVPCDSTC
jgi:hypothetical protein